MYYKRIDSGAVDAESPRENREGRGRVKEAERKKVEGLSGARKRVRRERRGGERDSEPCIVKRIEAHPDESIPVRIDFARAYLVDNGIQTRQSGTFCTCSRRVLGRDNKKKKKQKESAVTQCAICAHLTRCFAASAPRWKSRRGIERQARFYATDE